MISSIFELEDKINNLSNEKIWLTFDRSEFCECAFVSKRDLEESVGFFVNPKNISFLKTFFHSKISKLFFSWKIFYFNLVDQKRRKFESSHFFLFRTFLDKILREKKFFTNFSSFFFHWKLSPSKFFWKSFFFAVFIITSRLLLGYWFQQKVFRLSLKEFLF